MASEDPHKAMMAAALEGLSVLLGETAADMEAVASRIREVGRGLAEAALVLGGPEG